MQQFSNMKFRYNPEKNTKILANREIGLDEIANAMVGGNVLAVTDHHNKIKYPNQKIAYVSVVDKVYVVPYVQEDKDGKYSETYRVVARKTGLRAAGHGVMDVATFGPLGSSRHTS
ncbi:MAG: hypothetical protein AABY27_01380 [Pseudomonadota bacterium]